MEYYPKRRKHKCNPYTLKYNEKNDTYTVTFKDGEGVTQCVAITKEIYNAMDKFELEDLSELNEYDNHIEHSEVYEITLNTRAINKPLPIDEVVEKNIESIKLKKAINHLSEIQRKRIKLYYFEDKTVEEIAKIDNTTHQAVSKSIRKSVEEIKKFLKN